jgi:hypothetical protein
MGKVSQNIVIFEMVIEIVTLVTFKNLVFELFCGWGANFFSFFAAI